MHCSSHVKKKKNFLLHSLSLLSLINISHFLSPASLLSSFFLHFPHLLSSSSTASPFSQPSRQPSFDPSPAPTHLADLPTHSANKPISPTRPSPASTHHRCRPISPISPPIPPTKPSCRSEPSFGFRGFHLSIQALGFIIEAAAAFLRLLLWFSVDPSLGFFFFFALREFDCRGVGVAWWVGWVWAWLIFFFLCYGLWWWLWV